VPKLKLELSDLNVESFETELLAQQRGTVAGFNSTADRPCNTCETGCWGLCGGDPSAALSACCGTNACTQDPMNPYCYDSMNYCVETQAETCQADCETNTCG
jgi:hypothetical protein